MKWFRGSPQLMHVKFQTLVFILKTTSLKKWCTLTLMKTETSSPKKSKVFGCYSFSPYKNTQNSKSSKTSYKEATKKEIVMSSSWREKLLKSISYSNRFTLKRKANKNKLKFKTKMQMLLQRLEQSHLLSLLTILLKDAVLPQQLFRRGN